jgi:zinc transporter ZupT
MNSNLLIEAFIISLTIAALSIAPLYSARIRSNSKLFFLLGTGALAGICFFELLPDVFKMGGRWSIAVTGIVWVAYSILHLFHLGHHHHHDTQTRDPGLVHKNFSVAVFLGSMIAHCMASGMLLVLSDGFTRTFSHTVFLALLAHKTYEALTVSSILLETQKSRRGFITSVSLYALSFPAGVVVTYLAGSLITQNVALFGTSLAVGTLLGCLIFDFLMPSLTHLKKRRADLAWIFVGLLATQAVFLVL